MSIDAMKAALEALEYIRSTTVWNADKNASGPAIAALRLAIEQAERQEPVLKPCWYESKEKTMCRKCGQVHAEAILPNQEKQEPVAYVSGYYAGRCVIEPLNRAMVMPDGMALYTAPPQQEKQEPLAYAGVTIWVGEKTVTQLVTGVEIRHEALPGMSIEFAAKKCLSLLAAHGIGGEHG